MKRSNEITLESIKDKSYEEMTYEERQFFCEYGHLLSENDDPMDNVMVVDDVDEYLRQRGDVIDLCDLDKVLNIGDTMSIEEAKERTIESVRKIYEENGNL